MKNGWQVCTEKSRSRSNMPVSRVWGVGTTLSAMATTFSSNHFPGRLVWCHNHLQRARRCFSNALMKTSLCIFDDFFIYIQCFCHLILFVALKECLIFFIVFNQLRKTNMKLTRKVLRSDVINIQWNYCYIPTQLVL